MENKTKDKRINIRLDEDTYFAIKKLVENDLKTDISTYCRSLLWISTLHDATIYRIQNAIKQFGAVKDTEDLEYMITIKNEIKFIEDFLKNMKENRKKYDDFISMIEKWHESIKNEARQYFSKHNEIIEKYEKEYKEWYGDEYDTDPTMTKIWGGKINI